VGAANAELLRQMARASAEWDAGVERDLVRAIAAADLLVPLREEADGGRGVWATADDTGRTQVVAFTDPGAVEAWAGAPTPYAVMPGVELANVAVGADAGALWIDPGRPHGGRLDRRTVDVIAAGPALGSDAP
jgi:SseB protein N-terminal domain